MLSLDGNEDQIVGALRQRLAELEQCALQRAGLEDMLKDMKRKDNILPKLMTTSGSYEDLFKKEMGKYDQVSQEVARNIENQERLFHQIKLHNDAFAATFNLKDFNNQKEKAFNQVRAAVAKYREIRENINEGLKFYVTLQDAITNLKQQCSDYVMTRSIQCREMMDDLQRQIAGLSFTNDNRPSRTYPSVGAGAPAASSQDSSYYNSGSAPSYGAQAPARPPYYAGQQQAGMPPPPYYAQPPAQAPSHSQNFSQPPYPGWQGPYYNGPPAPPAAPQTPQAPHPGAPPQPPHHGGFFSAFYKQ